MNFSKSFTDLEKIQLLQRSILVNSYIYYELNENLLSDFQYDAKSLLQRLIEKVGIIDILITSRAALVLISQVA